MTIHTKASTEVQEPSLVRAFILSVLLVMVDAFWLNQGAIAMLVGLGLLLVFGLNALNNRLAQSRADLSITAMNSFHSENQGYPQSLEELVPRYIKEVPLAKYTLMFNQFGYARSETDTHLEYMDLPPFGRPIYSFQKREWFYLD